MKAHFLLIIFVIIFLACCSPVAKSENPAWVDKLMTQFENDLVGNPPQSIWRDEYNGQTVYFIPAQCCDMFSTLYDANGNVICAPDGGITGKGDGKCPNFFSKRTNEQLVWKDSRSR